MTSPSDKEGWPESQPGWYLRRDQVNTLAYFDGKDFTGPTMPAEIKLEVNSLVRGVAWGVVVGTLVNGIIFWLLYLALR